MLPWDTAAAQLAQARNYWIVTTRPNGAPHATPVWGVWLADTFYFAVEPESQKSRNLRANPELVMHLESGDDVVILSGRAERVFLGTELSSFLDAYEAKYGLRPPLDDSPAHVFRLRHREALAWRERDFARSATRFVFPG